jgi:hypothetical protein
MGSFVADGKATADGAAQRPAPQPTAMDNFYAKLLPALEVSLPLQVYGREPHQFLSFVKVRAPVWFNVGVRDQGMDVMQAAGVDRLASRKEWPLEVLKQVLADLMRGVPRSLLERQIWSGSASSWDWWQRQQAHSRSSAVMSMVPPPPLSFSPHKNLTSGGADLLESSTAPCLASQRDMSVGHEMKCLSKPCCENEGFLYPIRYMAVGRHRLGTTLPEDCRPRNGKGVDCEDAPHDDSVAS